MYCLKCGAQLADTAKFCHVCGAVVQKATPPPPDYYPPEANETAARRVPRRLLGCGVALLGVLLVGGLALIIAYYALGLHRSADVAELAPEDAAATVTIRPSLLQLSHLRDTDRVVGGAAAFAPLLIVPGMSGFVMDLQADYGPLLENAPINPAEDIMPWIGREVGLTAVDEFGSEVVVAAAVRNEERVAAFLADLQEYLEDEGVEFDESDHHGARIIEVVGPTNLAPVALAVTDGRLLLASSRDTLEDALDRAGKGRNTLAGNDAFIDAMAAQPGNQLGTLYISPDVLASELEGYTPDALRWIGGSFAMTGDGLRFNYKFGYDLDALDDRQREWLERGGIANDLARRVPADTILYFSAADMIGALDYAADTIPDFEEGLDEIRNDNELAGLYRLLEMMTGEFALAITSADEGLLQEMIGEPYGLLIASQMEDGDDARAELDDAFDDIARDIGVEYDVDEFDGVEVGYLEDGFVGRFLGYGVDGDDMVVGTSEGLLEAALEADDPLAGDERFRATMNALPGDSLGYFYLDLSEVRELFAGLVGVALSTVEDYSKSIEAFGLALEPLDRGGMQNAELFFLFESPR